MPRRPQPAFASLSFLVLIGLVVPGVIDVAAAQEPVEVTVAAVDALSETDIAGTPLLVPPFQSVASSQTTAPAERQDWLARMNRAEADVSRARWITVGGAGIFGLGAVIAAKDRRTGYTSVTDYGFSTAKALYVLGAGVAGYGIWQWSRASSEMTELEEEGRSKGFTVRVAPSTTLVEVVASF